MSTVSVAGSTSTSTSAAVARDDVNDIEVDDNDDEGVSGLELDDLNPESLFTALTAVEKAIPHLLQSVKPILSHLSSSSGSADEESGILARANIEKYMSLVDKIQFVLRQTVYYLRETGISNNTLNPPSINSIPTPFASSLPPSQSRDGDKEDKGEDEKKVGNGIELGLYASRIEVKTLKEFQSALKTLLLESEKGVHLPIG